MSTVSAAPGREHLALDREQVARAFDRTPFGFDHDLDRLELFSLEALAQLAERYDQQYMVASGATDPAQEFYSVRMGGCTARQAFDRLEAGNQRILLKAPERYDARYRELLDELFALVLERRGGLGGAKVVRLASSVLITSRATITPFHFDPEITFFFQIAGQKRYHLYEPAALSEHELERFYRMGIVNIGQVDFANRDPAYEHVFALEPGKGMHQPQNCPHWVETGAAISISYAFSFETDRSRALGRVRAFNYYQRRLGRLPTLPGRNRAADALKSETMRLAIPLRKSLGSVVRGAAARLPSR
ncbi:MAG: hypothetical protein ACREQ5_17050 [Candidatus Dormibacteria bacterium]